MSSSSKLRKSGLDHTDLVSTAKQALPQSRNYYETPLLSLAFSLSTKRQESLHKLTHQIKSFLMELRPGGIFALVNT